MRVVIIGGVAGGASAAARLRRLNETTHITLLEKGPYISYANCGLPYYIGGTIQDENELFVQTPEGFKERFNIEVCTNTEAVAVDTAAKLVRVARLDEGSQEDLPYDALLLAPGAKPVVPLLAGAEDERVFTLRSVPDTFAIKQFLDTRGVRRCVIVGAGYIGLEMADVLAGRGIEVTLLERAPSIMATLDEEMAASVEQVLCADGIGLHTGCAVTAFTQGQDGSIVTQTDQGDFPADMVLLSVGVQPDTAFLQGSGVALDAKGAILVDEHLQTNLPGVYAVGDAAAVRHIVTGQQGSIPLAGPANRQGRVAADNIAGLQSRYAGGQGSAICRVLGWTVAATGINERTARAAGIACDKVYVTAASHAGYYPGAVNINIKLLFEVPSGRILGAQLVGRDGVDKRCDVIATALRAGLTARDLTELELCYAPPYSAAKDPVNIVGYVAENVLTGKVKQYFWQDLKKLPGDGSVTLLDVRGGGEVRRGQSPAGFVHIPLDELRDRLAELDRAKPVYVTCQSGLRSYIACRILMENGFDAYNFAGGYGLYQSLMKKV